MNKNKDISKGKLIILNLIAIYTHKIKTAYDTHEIMKLAENHWSLATKDIPLERIKIAIELVRDKMPWPPSISEFLELCMPTLQELKLPHAANALHVFLSNNLDAHSIFTDLKKKLNVTELRKLTEHEALKKFTIAYTEAKNEYVMKHWKNEECVHLITRREEKDDWKI